MTKNIYVADFETTVFDGQTKTEVWAWAITKLNTEDVAIGNKIETFFDYIFNLKQNCIIYFHNLKFDGNFILSYIKKSTNLREGIIKTEDSYRIKNNDELINGEYTYLISAMGQWYSIKIKYNSKIIEFRDSLKLLPFSVSVIGESFDTKHKKTEIDYKLHTKAGEEISELEKEYIKNDVFVVKEALEILMSEGHKKATIGSCCLSEYWKIMGDYTKSAMPDVYNIKTPKYIAEETAGDWIKKSYRGGWCYLADEKKRQILSNGVTLDVNSLYPSMMHSESGNRYPIGKPIFWGGNGIPEEAEKTNSFYFIRFSCRFELKDGYLPFVQIKGNFLYSPIESLRTSDVYDFNTGKYCRFYKDCNGEIKEARVTLTMTQMDYKLFLEHYNVYDLEILEGCYFRSESGLFDKYIDKFRKIKENSKGARRQLAKLFLNNLYGKMATSTDSSFKKAYIGEEGELCFTNIIEHNKKPGYIPIGSAITSYARCFTIRAAQKNYHGKDHGFVYADTDSIHCDIPLESIKGVDIDDKKFCCWKVENKWDTGIFIRQKTYIEKEKDDYIVKCAGMPNRCKELFVANITGTKIELKTEDEKKFMSKKLTLKDFDYGLKVPSKLLPHRVDGGVVLVETEYEIRGRD